MSELYPGRSAVVPEMLAAWKRRNEYSRATDWRASYGCCCDEMRIALSSLRRVWHALRDAR
jgi:hypothetical protein